MTIEEFHIAFDLELDKTLDFDYPYMIPEQKDYWLNKGQDRFIKSRAFGNNLKQKGFEETEKRIDDLRTIVTMSDPLDATNVGDLYSITLPDDYLYLVRHRVTTDSDKYGTLTVSGVQTNQDEINIFETDPFWKPMPFEPLYYIIGNNIVYETQGTFNVIESLITYIRKYNKLQYGTTYIDPTTDIQCELPVHTHQEIVDITIAMVLENIESQRYQTNLNELTKSE